MSKELTEQWRNGTLPLNHYYVERKTGSVFIDNTVVHFDERIPFTRLRWQEDIKEVLAPVPTYEEWVKNGTWYTKKSHNELLKKIEELECQLKEANEIIKSREPFWAEYDYFEKWGVE